MSHIIECRKITVNKYRKKCDVIKTRRQRQARNKPILKRQKSLKGPNIRKKRKPQKIKSPMDEEVPKCQKSPIDRRKRKSERDRINDKQIPLYFTFAALTPKCNLTTDKYMSLENWICLFDELDEILRSGNSRNSTNSSSSGSSGSKKTKSSFSLENGRLSVKTKWIKTSDKADVGNYILKFLNLSSANAEKYFLKIDVRLHSDFDQLITHLENKALANKRISTDQSKVQEKISQTHQNSDDSIVGVLPKVKKDRNETSLISKNTSDDGETYDVLDIINYNVEEYIPTPSTASKEIENGPKYQPEKNVAQIEINKIKSEYSPTNMNPEKSTNEIASYRPSTQSSKESSRTENADSRKSQKHRTRRRSADLFESSDGENVGEGVSSSSHSQNKSKRKKGSTTKKDRKSSNERAKTKKASLTKIGDLTIRNLMNESIEDILATYSEHSEYLTELYAKQMKHNKRNYRLKNIPPLAIHDILSTDQQDAMIQFLDKNLRVDPHEDDNSLSVIFDAILPAWGFEIFGKTFNCTREEAIKRLNLQASVVNQQSDSFDTNFEF